MDSSNITYSTKAEANLAVCSDTGPWMPSAEIRNIFPNALKMMVKLIDPETDLNRVNKCLVKEKRIGLIVMGTKVGRNCKPALIVLSTSSVFFAIDPDDISRGIKFLKMKLNDPQLEFWTSNCYAESDCLYYNYGIDLRKLNAKSCVGLHLTIMKKMAFLPECARLAYPVSQRSYGHLSLEKFDDLVQMWTRVDRSDIRYGPDQLAHLMKRPLTQTAINVIKKRCILVLDVARRLVAASEKELTRLSSTMFMRSQDNNQPLRQISLELFKRAQENRQADAMSFAHLLSG